MDISADFISFHEGHGLINYTDTTAKCRQLINLLVKGLCGRSWSVWGPPPPLGFCLGWSNSFVGSKSGQIQRVILQKNMVSNRVQHPPPPPSHTVCIYCNLTQGRGEGGGSWAREKVRGATVHKAGSKYQNDSLYLQSINSDKHLPPYHFTGKFF